MLVGSYNESDESFARRLQAQELSHFSIHQPNNGNIDSQTPLMVCQHLVVRWRQKNCDDEL